MADSFQHIRAMSKIKQDLDHVHVSVEYMPLCMKHLKQKGLTFNLERFVGIA